MLLCTFICINGRDPTALTTGIYVARAELKSVLFEG
jgi:hypothetical protein